MFLSTLRRRPSSVLLLLVASWCCADAQQQVPAEIVPLLANGSALSTALAEAQTAVKQATVNGEPVVPESGVAKGKGGVDMLTSSGVNNSSSDIDAGVNIAVSAQ